MKNVYIISLVIISIFFSIQCHSQNNIETNNINCDSLLDAVNYKGFMPIDKMPATVRPLDEIQNEFTSQIDTNLFNSDIIIHVVIDTSGNALCPYIFSGVNKIIDSMAIEYLRDLKFTPAMQNNRKLPVRVAFHFYNWNLKETYTLIRVGNKWELKK